MGWPAAPKTRASIALAHTAHGCSLPLRLISSGEAQDGRPTAVISPSRAHSWELSPRSISVASDREAASCWPAQAQTNTCLLCRLHHRIRPYHSPHLRVPTQQRAESSSVPGHGGHQGTVRPMPDPAHTSARAARNWHASHAPRGKHARLDRAPPSGPGACCRLPPPFFSCVTGRFEPGTGACTHGLSTRRGHRPAHPHGAAGFSTGELARLGRHALRIRTTRTSPSPLAHPSSTSTSTSELARHVDRRPAPCRTRRHNTAIGHPAPHGGRHPATHRGRA